MKTWYHEVSGAWLEARKRYITATELVGLIPAYKRELKSLGEKKVLDHIPKDFAALWAEKHSSKELDVASFNSAARGHYMEPYAIDDYNWQRLEEHPEMYHWDDALIHNGLLAFSPDGLDVEQPVDSVELGFIIDEDGCAYLKRDDGKTFVSPRQMIEIKSYDVGKHTKLMLTPPDKIDERFQLAVAMMVCKTIEKATLCFYNPQAHHSMFTRVYTRDSLKEEIELLEEVAKMYEETCSKMDAVPSQMKAMYTEDRVYQDCYDETHSVLSNMKGDSIG